MPRIKLNGLHVLDSHGNSRRGVLLVEGDGEAWSLPDFDNERVIFQEADDWPRELDEPPYMGRKPCARAVGVVDSRGLGIFVIDPASIIRLKRAKAGIEWIPKRVIKQVWHDHALGALLTQSDVLQRGFTLSDIRRELGEPDCFGINPRGGSHVLLYSEARVRRARLKIA